MEAAPSSGRSSEAADDGNLRRRLRHERRKSETGRKEEREGVREVRALTSKLEVSTRSTERGHGGWNRRRTAAAVEGNRRPWRRYKPCGVDSSRVEIEGSKARR
jgi:hypothetical protein